MAADITKTGTGGLKGLPGINQQGRNNILDQILNRSINTYNSQNDTPIGVQAAQVGYGDSQYDDAVTSVNQFDDLNETRYAEQPWYDVLANGVGKMLGTAGTTFVSSLVGIPAGIKTAFQEGRVSGIWDNDVTAALSAADKWLEENMTNYQSAAQQEDPHFRLGDMNWWADNFIKNIGFTLGAAASMAVTGGAMGLLSKAFKFVDTVGKGAQIAKSAAQFTSALYAATGEGMIEARQAVEERNKLKMLELDDAFNPEYSALEMEERMINEELEANRGRNAVYNPETGQMEDPAQNMWMQRMDALQAKKAELDRRKNAAVAEIEESGRSMGNRILAGNQVFLTLGNLIQFGKGIAKSFDRARHTAQVINKAERPAFVGATRASNDIRKGYELYGKNVGRLAAGTKGIITEGQEEMNQQWISSAATAYYDRKDVNDYWRARLDKDSLKEASDGSYALGEAISKGFKESWGTPSQWEQFLIGGLTGATGVVMPTKVFNQDKTKSKWNPARYFSWEGGAVNDLREFRDKYNQYAENIEDLNKVVAQGDFVDRIQRLGAHTLFQKNKDYAAETNQKKLWKDADDKQTIIDIQSFVRAGKLDDLRALYNSLGESMSDEDIDDIINRTSGEITAEEDKQNNDRRIDNEIAKVLHNLDNARNQMQSLVNMETEASQVAPPKDIEEQKDKLSKKIMDLAKKADDLRAEKANYVGKGSKYGVFITEDGNRQATRDQFRAEMKHNSEELNRKLDSYLESVAQVQKDTGGKLSKNQEDNLAYLHNMGKESEVRFGKIISKIRKHLPKKFLLKTNKTPEQLSKELVVSDITFAKNELTPEGYVEADTSTMDDSTFGNFFVRDVLWGGNINADFSKTVDEKGYEGLSSEEIEKKIKEAAEKISAQNNEDRAAQRNTNWDMITNNFMASYKPGNGQHDSMRALVELYSDIADAVDLLDQAGQYRATLTEYMLNPEKIEEDKAAEEKKQQDDTLKDKFRGKNAKDINAAIANGDAEQSDADAFFDILNNKENLSAEEKEDLDALKNFKEIGQIAENMHSAIAKAAQAQMDIAAMSGGTADMFDQIARATEEAEKLVEALKGQALTAEDMDPEKFIQEIEKEREALDKAYDEIAGFDPDNTRELSYDFVLSALEEQKKAEEKGSNIPAKVPKEAPATPETGSDPVAKVDPVLPSTPPPASVAPIGETVISPVTPSMVDALAEAVNSVTSGESVSGIWRNTTRRFAYHSMSKPYHEFVKDTKGVDSLEYKRSKAIYDYLVKNNAFDAVENADNPILKEGKTTVHFMVKNLSQEIFGKSYDQLDDTQKPIALAIILLDDSGQVLGDLPLAEWEPSARSGSPVKDVSLLLSLEKKIIDAYDENYSKNKANEAVVDNTLTKEGAQNLGLKYKNGKPLVSKVMQVMNGKAPFARGERTLLNDVAEGQDFLLGILVSNSDVATSGTKNDPIKRNILGIRNVKIGTPLYLLPTSAGKYIPVPFYTPSFSVSAHSDTDMYKLIVAAIRNIITSNDKAVYKTNMDVIQALLQVKPQPGVKRAFEITSSNITMHMRNLLNPDEKIEIKVPNTGTPEDIARALAKAFDGVNINVSTQFINRDIATGTASGDLKFPYNKVIGQIANVSLMPGTRHSVGSWFTLALTADSGMSAPKKVSYPKGAAFPYNINGKTVIINPLDFTAKDQTTGQPVTDEDVMLVLADVKATNNELTTPFKMKVGEKEVWTYDPSQKKFTSKTTSVTVRGAEPAIPDNGGSSADADFFFDFLNSQNTPPPPSAEDAPPPPPPAPEGTPITLVLPPSSSPSTPPASSEVKMSLEDVNKKMAGVVVTPQTQAAWDAIPDEMKLKMVNDGISLTVTYGRKKQVISAKNTVALKQALQEMNSIAKMKGKLDVEENPKTMEDVGETRLENERQVKKWLAKNLPMLTKEERIQFVKKLTYAGKDGRKVWGTYKNSIIQILENAPMGTTYHEAFHYVMDMLLDMDQRKNILQAAKERYGNNLTNLELEERLAEDFRKYCINENNRSIMGRLKRWFRKILDAIRRTNTIDDSAINTLFWNINNGKFAKTPVSARSYNRYIDNIARETHMIRMKRFMWNNLTADQRQSLQDAGLSEAKYSNMSLVEQEQWVKCRT